MIHTCPGGRGKLWGCAQSLLPLSHSSHSCASKAIVLVPTVGNPRSSWKRPTHIVPGDPRRPQKQKKKGGFSSPYIRAPSRLHFLPLPANTRELLISFSWLSPPKGTSDASGRSLESRMWGCERAPGHKEAAEEEGAPALPCEAGHGNRQQGEGVC